MGANVLAIAPRRCVMVEGNPATRARLETAGAEVLVYGDREISRQRRRRSDLPHAAAGAHRLVHFVRQEFGRHLIT